LVGLACGRTLLKPLLGSALVLRRQYFDPATFRDDYRNMARRIEAGARPGDAVMLNAPNQWEVFTYYHRGGAPVYPMPRSRQPDPARAAAELAQIARDHNRLFVLYWGDGQADPQRAIEGWLNAHTYKLSEEWVGDVRFAAYAVPGDAAGYPVREVDAAFGGNLHLDRIALPPDLTLHPGQVLALTLYWSLERPDLQPYKVFLHLTADPAQPPPVQQDSEPQGGLSPTGGWVPGQSYADNHGLLLPAGLPPGEYRLLVGLYNPATGERLPLTAGGEGDALLLQTFWVVP
ncbi:MAG: hypothetical protein HY784_15870, partial [Chloroflexi bacterium]|nr:hypothetical protein [Chloroflexota bacterium]